MNTQLHFDEACAVAGVSPSTARVWRHRKVVDFAWKSGRTHRLYVSDVETIRIAVVGRLSAMFGIDPAQADTIARLVAAEYLRRRANGARDNVVMLVSLIDGRPHGWVYRDGVRSDPIGDAPSDVISGPALNIPASEIIDAITANLAAAAA